MATLSIGCTFSDRIEALLDGRVTVAGQKATLHIVEAQRLFRSVLRDAAYDVAELSMASHIAAMGAGRRAYVGIPVFLSRSFRHANLYVRTDRGIDAPGDLAGRTIGLIDYQQTAGVWLRGLLSDDYSVSRQSVRWVTAGLHTPVLDDRVAMVPPEGVRVERSSSTLDRLLAEGRIDAVISPGAPPCFLNGSAPVDRLWRDPREAGLAWFRQTRIFPIMHLLVVRRTLLDTCPDILPALYGAFDEARRLAAADLVSRDFPKLALPWLNDHANATHRALGRDPWTYGLDDNRHVLETLMRYAALDGLCPSDLTVDDIFS